MESSRGGNLSDQSQNSTVLSANQRLLLKRQANFSVSVVLLHSHTGEAAGAPERRSLDLNMKDCSLKEANMSLNLLNVVRLCVNLQMIYES